MIAGLSASASMAADVKRLALFHLLIGESTPR